MLVFSEQDVIKDPPFSKLDLISCRNLLIYLEGELQKKIIALFHYALRPNGALFLGTSETVGELESIFAVIDRKSRLYRRKEGAHLPYRPAVGRYLPTMVESEAAPAPVGKAPAEGKLPVRELTERELLQQYAPVGVLVNERGDILYIHGRTGQYLEPAAGEASSMNILKMAREGVRRDLTTMLHKAASQRKALRTGGLKVKSNGSYVTLNLAVRPMPSGPNLFLVLFEEAPAPDRARFETAAVEKSAEAAKHPDAGDDDSIAALRRELRAKEEYLQATNEELETSNEELKSSNEEMQSVNEELQSTNEELETSKEELQSVNEELATVNTELQQKVTDLSRANNDMNNLLAGTGVGTVFVDLELNITRFTPAATQLINLIQTDVGRPMGHIVSNLLVYDRLVEDVQAVLDSLVPKEIEVESKAGAWYSMRIRPYRTLENVIEGAVVTFLEITEQKRVQESLRESESLRRLAAVVRDSNDAVTMMDFEGRILAWNPEAERLYGWSEAEALSMKIGDMVPADSGDETLSRMRRLSKGEKLEPFRSQRLARNGEILDVWLTISALVDASGRAYAVSTIERQIQIRRSSDKDD
jgi:two-component system, chemotaxis family, CheB/CheR fusion protein